MRNFRVGLLGGNEEYLSLLKSRVEGTLAGEVVLCRAMLPAVAADPVVRQVRQLEPDVVLVDIDPERPEAGLAAIEALAETATVFAVGAMNQPQTIIRAMRSGACEFLDRDLGSGTLLEGFSRLQASRQSRNSGAAERGKIITVVSAKGGCGATTVAVNCAVALQKQHGPVALVDLAPLGHASLHLNVRPQFGLRDAVSNLHRMDGTLLEGLMTEAGGGIRLLAGLDTPAPLETEQGDLALLFDLLVGHYKYVVVDASNRLDKLSRAACDVSQLVLLVVQADVSSLWSAARVAEFLGGDSSRIQLLVNRYRKIAGFSDEDARTATACRVFWKIPNQFNAVGPAIDRGSPVAFQGNLEVARSFSALAEALTGAGSPHGASAAAAENRGKEESRRALDRVIRLSTAPVR